jgi:hypothetical protein
MSPYIFSGTECRSFVDIEAESVLVDFNTPFGGLLLTACGRERTPRGSFNEMPYNRVEKGI